MKDESQYSQVRKQDIHFRRSILRFSIAFVVVFMCGAVTRGLVAQFPIAEKLKQAIKVPENQTLTFHKPQIVFRRGWVPVIGLHISRVDWQNNRCASNRLSLQDSIVVLDPIKLLQGELAPGRIKVDFLEFSYSQSCGKELVGPVQPSQQIKKPEKKGIFASKKRAKKESYKFLIQAGQLKKLFEEDLDKLAQVDFSHLDVEKFRIHIVKSVDNEITFEGEGKLGLAGNLQADLKFQKFYYQEQDLDFLSTRLKLNLSRQQAEFDIVSLVREGKIQWKTLIKNETDYPVESEININKMPISPIVGFAVEDLPINYLWLSCQASVSSSIKKMASSPIQFGDCKAEGPYGEALVTQVKAFPHKVEEFNVEINKLQLDKVFKERRDLYFSGVLANYGVFSAQVKYARSLYDIKGHLNRSEFIFSNNNLRDIQKIETIPFHFQGNADAWQAKLDKIKLDEGEFAGELLVHKKSQNEPQGRIAIHKLRFNPRIYKLILNSDPTDVRIYGKFKWNENRVDDWSALVATEELNSEMYNFKNLKVKGERMAEDKTSLRISVADGVLNEKSPLVSWLRPTHLDKAWKPGPIPFVELSARLDISRNRNVEWKRGYIRLKNKWQLSSEGIRDRAKGVVAWLQWDRPDGKYLKWNYTGSFFDGAWEPLTPWVKAWLDNRKDYLDDNQAIKYKSVKDMGEALQAAPPEK